MITKSISALSNLSKWVKSNRETFEALAITIGVVLVVKLVLLIKTFFASGAAALFLFKGVMTLVAGLDLLRLSTLKAIWPFILLHLGTIAIIAVFVLLFLIVEDVWTSLNGGKGVIIDFCKSAIAWLKELWSNVKEALSNFKDLVYEKFTMIKEWLFGVANDIYEYFMKKIEKFLSIVKKVKDKIPFMSGDDEKSLNDISLDLEKNIQTNLTPIMQSVEPTPNMSRIDQSHNINQTNHNNNTFYVDGSKNPKETAEVIAGYTSQVDNASLATGNAGT